MFMHRSFCTFFSLFVFLALLSACREQLPPPTGPDPGDNSGQTISSSVASGIVVARVASFSEDSVIVTWSDQDGDRSAYVVEYKNASGDSFLTLAKVGPSDFAYVDIRKKEVLRSYYYRLVATKRTGEQVYSNVVPLLLNPRRPLAVRPTHLSATRIELQWNFTGNISEGFIIERSTDGTSYTRVGATARDQLLFEDSPLDTSFVYYYRAFTLTRYAIGPSSVPVKIAYTLNPQYNEWQWMIIS